MIILDTNVLSALRWSRWQEPNRPHTAEEYRKLGVDYLVVRPGIAEPILSPVFANSQLVVYRFTTWVRALVASRRE